MLYQWVWFLFFHSSMARPNLIVPRDDPQFEWTALGDSYASGVGSTGYVDGRRCLRYDQAYPVLLNGDAGLAEGEHIFNNVVCSGAHSEDVELYQFYDEDTTNQPSYLYCMRSLNPVEEMPQTHVAIAPRPKFGNPQMATLAVGGDDIDFPGILFNCILETHIYGGPPQRSCDDQKAHSWGLINSPDLVNNIDHLINSIVTKGRKGSIGNDFKLYVTGYGEFFNADDPGCNEVTFARTANPNPDGKDHVKLTTDLRKEFNDMSKALNTAIEAAVNRNLQNGVRFVDIQGNGALDGHRFCEPGVQEPDQQNDNLWFWHYPYNEPNNQNTDLLQEASDSVTNGLSIEQLNSKYPETTDYTNAILDAIDFEKAQQVNGNDVEAKGLWDYIGFRTKVFHPQVSFHTHIKDLILAQYKQDQGTGSSAPSPPAPNESLICQDPGQASFQLTDATSHFEEYCAHFDGQIYPAITNHVSALREFYLNSAGVWVELWSNIAADDSCKQGEVRFSRGDCLTGLADAANKCHNDDGTSTGGNAEPFNCANFGFIGNTADPGPQTPAVTTTEPIPTVS